MMIDWLSITSKNDVKYTLELVLPWISNRKRTRESKLPEVISFWFYFGKLKPSFKRLYDGYKNTSLKIFQL